MTDDKSASLPRFRCRICKSELIEEARPERCTYCELEETGAWHCPQAHYVCEACRTAQACTLIERTCLRTRLTGPQALAGLILKHPSMPAYGPEFHLLAAPVLLAVLRNRGVAGIGDETIRGAMARLDGLPEAACATRGECGAAVSAGVVLSWLRRATTGSDAPRSDALRATAAALCRIADHGGPRCCRQSVFDTIRVAWGLVADELGLEALPPWECDFSGRLPDCKRERCPYHHA